MEQKQLMDRIKDKINKTVESYIENLDSKVNLMITKSICSLTGLAHRGYSDYSIDHCNGRSSILTSIIENRARTKVEKIVKEFKFDNERMPLIKKAFEKEFEEKLKRCINYQAERLSGDICSKIISEYTEKELIRMGFNSDAKELNNGR